MALNHLLPILGTAGVGMGLGGMVLSQLDPNRHSTVLALEGLGLLCLFVYFVGNWNRLKTFSGRRSTRLGFNGILSILLMTGILVIINFLVIRHGGRWDFSETQHFSLAPQTLQVLGTLKQDVAVTVFSHERSPGFRTYRDLLEGYTYASPRMSVTYVDPEKAPDKARNFEISKIDVAVFQSGERTIHVTTPTESNLTSALIRVTNDHAKRLIFLEGHGERRITDQDRGGLSLARDNLEAHGYTVARGSLLTDSALLEDADVLVVPGPRESLAPVELRRITRFASEGGRLLFLLDPRTTTGLDPWVSDWGITLGPGIVVDPVDRVAQGSPTALLVRRFTNHVMTEGFTAPVLLPVSHSVTFDQRAAAADLTFTPLMHSSDRSWAETTFHHTTPEFEEGHDIKGPFALAGVLARKPEPSGSPVTPAMVIVGNSAFASNAYVKFPGNADFLLNAVSWLADEGTLISISPKESTFAPFIPNPTQEHVLLAVQVFSIPFLFLFLGIMIRRRRRSL